MKPSVAIAALLLTWCVAFWGVLSLLTVTAVFRGGLTLELRLAPAASDCLGVRGHPDACGRESDVVVEDVLRWVRVRADREQLDSGLGTIDEADDPPT